MSQIREATRGDPVLSRAMYYILHGWPAEKCIPDELKIYYNKQDEFTVEDGCILRGTRAVIPTKFQAAVLSELHLNHPGMVRMKSLARLHVWWPSLDHDVEQTVRDCHACQANRCKSPEKVNNPWIWPTRPWQRIHVDFAGPFAQEMKDFLKSNGIRHCLSSPYHPASNGEVERALRTFKESMKTVKDEPGTLADKLARFLLRYWTTPHTATGCTPAELLMGRRIRTRLDILHPDLSAKMSKKTKLGNHTTRRNFLPGDPVMVRDYRDRKRLWIKGIIQDRLGPVTYQAMVGNLFWKRHVDQLRCLAGSKVADTESKVEIPLDDAYPDVTPSFHPEQPPIESTDSQADSTLVVPPSPNSSQDLVPVPAPEAPDLSQSPKASTTEEPAKVTEVPAKALVSKRYPTRIRTKLKRLIEVM